MTAAALAALLALAIFCGWRYLTPVAAPAAAQPIDLIVVEKAAHRMVLFHHGKAAQVYAVALGRGGAGPKERAGDDNVPEGRYRIIGRNSRSAFHRSLRIGYPTARQAADAARRGIDPGGDVMIHGIHNGLGWLGGLHRTIDWTRGCIAVTDAEIEQIWRMVPDGTAIIIRP
ncbi:L,D-transpeptidase family protein [Sphingomonas sp. AR_OL41]|uniref:L,D-transpeptidase family protein n=1 Tax=Sphingomonas sp. AR_OL41 TaxID=3042729 RepID=UPI0024817AD5|nr:L,D-transpeptidase family protein [Sphingomonas sp. AR_OL41]MDH7975034.1 L,D-transpeptidase family protein [Sphingomonas sp. AR_OL41]